MAILVDVKAYLILGQSGFISNKADNLTSVRLPCLVSHLVQNVGGMLFTSPPNSIHCLCAPLGPTDPTLLRAHCPQYRLLPQHLKT